MGEEYRVGRACALKQQKVRKQDCGLAGVVSLHGPTSWGSLARPNISGAKSSRARIRSGDSCAAFPCALAECGQSQ